MEPKPNQRGIVIRNQWLSSDYMFPAANVTHADEVLSGLQTGKQRESSEGSIRIENHQQDSVGSLPILLGGNPATMNDNTQNRGFIRRILDMFGDTSSMHNCYGLGQKQCVTDGYFTCRRSDLI